MTRQNEIRKMERTKRSIPSLTLLFRAIFVMLFCFSLIQAIPLRIDLEKKTEGLVNPLAKLEIEKKAQCFQTEKAMECYALLKSGSIAFWEGDLSITSTNLQYQKIEYLSEIYRFNTTAEVCIRQNESSCIEWGRTTYQWAEFQQTPTAILTTNGYSAVKLVFPKWYLPNRKESFAVQAGNMKADPEVSSCGSTLTGAAGTIHYLTSNLNCTDTAITFGADNIELDCQGYTIEYARISAGHGVSATGRKNITIRNCNFIQQNASISSNGNGIYFVNDVQNSKIENCSFKLIGKTGGSAIQLGSYAATPVYNTTINNISILTTPNTAKGILIYAKGWTNITNFFINTTGSAEAYPIFADAGSQYTNIINGTIYSAYSYGLYFHRNDGGFGSDGRNYVRNVSITTTNTYPFVVRETNSSLFENMTITGTSANSIGIFLYLGSSFLQFKNININMTQASSTMVLFDRTYQNHLFENLNFRSTSNNFQINGSTQYGYVGGNITFRNLTGFNRNKVGFVGADIRNNFTLQWYVRVNVSWVNGTPIQGAIVNSTNEQGIFQSFGTTGADGLTDWVVMNDTMFRGAVSNISYALTNFTANTTNAYQNTTTFNVSQTNTITIYLAPIYIPPPKYLFVSHSSPANGWGNTSNTTLIGVVLKCNATSNDTIASIGVKIWNSTNSLIYQNITYGEQDEVSYPLMLPADTYVWQCNATSTTLANESGNRTFTLMYIPPPKALSVWQSYPANASVRTSPTTFNCSANISYEFLTTIGIKIWNETDLVYENVSVRSGNINISTFVASLPFGDYFWECNASGETLSNNSLYNFTITISDDTQAPLTILIYPETMQTIRSTEFPFSCKFKDLIETSFGYFTIWDVNDTLIYNQTVNISKEEELNITYFDLSNLSGSYIWTCGACDWLDNCQENSSKRYVFISIAKSTYVGEVNGVSILVIVFWSSFVFLILFILYQVFLLIIRNVKKG